MAPLFPDHWLSTPGKQRAKISAVNFPQKLQTLIITDLLQEIHVFVLTRFWRRFGDPISFQFFLQVHIDNTISINDTKQDSITKETCNHNKPRSGATIWGYNWCPFLFWIAAIVCLTFLHAARNRVLHYPFDGRAATGVADQNRLALNSTCPLSESLATPDYMLAGLFFHSLTVWQRIRKEKVTVKNEGKRAIGTDGMSRLSQRTMNNPQGKVHKRKEYEGIWCVLDRASSLITEE